MARHNGTIAIFGTKAKNCNRRTTPDKSAEKIKALTALVGRLSLSVCRENGWGLKTVLFYPCLPII